MKKRKKKLFKQSYRWIYDVIISKLYDTGLKIGLTPPGERLLRMSVYNSISPFIRRNYRILDLGCGTGTLTILLARLLYSDCELIGVDLSNGQIAKAQKKNSNSNLIFKFMDAVNLQFNNESFEIVIISAVLHEMVARERFKVLKEAYRILKNQGYLLIFDHHEPTKTRNRIFYNFYLGFWEKILSQSFEMQRKIFFELKDVGFNILSQVPVKKFHNFFQNILCKKNF